MSRRRRTAMICVCRRVIVLESHRAPEAYCVAHCDRASGEGASGDWRAGIPPEPAYRYGETASAGRAVTQRINGVYEELCLSTASFRLRKCGGFHRFRAGERVRMISADALPELLSPRS